MTFKNGDTVFVKGNKNRIGTFEKAEGDKAVVTVTAVVRKKAKKKTERWPLDLCRLAS